MNQPKETLLCPVCKSGISKETLIPIYTKGGSSEDPRKKGEIPKRPAGQRQGPVPNQNFSGDQMFGRNGGGGSGFMMGIGLFPALFTLNFTWDDIFGSGPEATTRLRHLFGGNPADGGNGANTEETRE
jgi:hypothetical protein